ncbi:MAG: hypothetical protein ACE5DY_05865 [Mariprofundaceae bacterium]
MRQPGTSSTWGLLISSLQVGAGLVILIGGHLIMACQLWFWGDEKSGLSIVAEATGLPDWILWLVTLAALAMDVWIAMSARRQKKKTRRR